MKYEDITFEMLGTRRQRPMYLSKFTKFRESLDMKSYPKDPHEFTQTFLHIIDEWINAHKRVQYKDYIFTRREQFRYYTLPDELHPLHGRNIAVYKGEYDLDV